MTAFDFRDGLSALAHNYDALACDAWGVIHNGRKIFPGVSDALMRFRETRGPVVILTNAPRPSTIIPDQLDRLNLPRAAWDGVVTSGDATRDEIARRAPAPAWRIGPAMDDPLFDGIEVNFSTRDEAAFIICTGLDSNFSDTPGDYAPELEAAAARGLPMICANPDIQVNWGGRLLWCAGALAEIYKRFGGEVIYGGKPHGPIYRLMQEKIATARSEQATPARILAIGDGLETDIRGANDHGIDAVLIAGAGGLLEGADSHDNIAAELGARDLSIVAAMKGLKW